MTTREAGNIARGWRGCSVLAVLWIVASVPPVRADDGTDVRFEVAPGIVADAHLRKDGWIDAGTNRSPGRQRLPATGDEEGRSSLDHDDYNFDGYQDLVSSATLGQVNEANRVYLYDPGNGGFRELQVPSNAEGNCGGFWSLAPDAASKTLTSSCRGGPLWYSDVYCYDGPRLCLCRAMRRVYLDVERLAPVLALEGAQDIPVLGVWSTYDPAGKVLERALGSALDTPGDGKSLLGHSAGVVPARLPLHDRPGEAATRRYLVAGDRVELLDIDEQENWIQVRYLNPARGAIRGWVQLPASP